MFEHFPFECIDITGNLFQLIHETDVWAEQTNQWSSVWCWENNIRFSEGQTTNIDLFEKGSVDKTIWFLFYFLILNKRLFLFQFSVKYEHENCENFLMWNVNCHIEIVFSLKYEIDL